MWNKHLLLTREQIRNYDKVAIETLGMPSITLMENAGAGTARLIARTLEAGQRVVVVAGPGNNGGDGYVIARHLSNMGVQVTTYLAVPRQKIRGDALINLQVLEAMDGPIVDLSSEEQYAEFTTALAHCNLVVDALLGTGVTRDVEGHLGELIDLINRAERPVVAVDIPSGLDADSGQPRGRAIRALLTATYGHLKRGLVLFPGAELAGEITVVPLGVPSSVSEKVGWDGELVTEHMVRSWLPNRRAEAHKGTFGHLLVLAGALGKTGAGALAGQAAMRVGTGLVTVATTAEAQPVLEAKCLETMVEPVLDNGDSAVTAGVMRRVEQLLEGKKAVAIGPGVSTAAGVSALVLKLVETLRLPVVVDADGLNILAAQGGATPIAAPAVLTPHPGEMARLLGTTTGEVQADRFAAARDAARRFDAVVVLKGAHSVIAAPDGRVWVNPTGNPGMASGGMGDVLTGMIGGWLAQGVAPEHAALLGVYLHGLAADRSVKDVGEVGLIATDVIDTLPAILREWEA